ncbi:MAG TPA: hypothetical protein VGY98_13685, partial [Verrucomicrobiae bacterium]|nr:hypothetical protein [Verrucomicrobiae bacterium]
PDQWNFNICLFALVLSLLTRWFFTPEQKRDLYLAALTEGLLLSDSQALLPTALALPFLVALGNPALGREIFFLLAALFCFALAINAQLHLFESFMNGATRIRDVTATALAALFWIVLLVKTRQFFSEWITSISCVTLFLAGISAYFLLPAFSMANPPVNWGYPRTVEGFFHVLSRGQYGQAEVATKLSDLLRQWFIYGNIAVDEFGAVYLAAAAIPLLFLRKMAPLNRKWFLGLFIVWLLVSELMLIHLNISWDNSTYELNETFFSATHFVLAILAGCGFMLAGAYYARSSKRKPRPLRGQC